MLAAEFGTGQVLWSILWFAIFVLWFWLVITVFADIVRSDTLTGWGRALWAMGIIFLPFLGIVLYLIVEGSSMDRRAVETSRRTPADERPPGSSTADELTRLGALVEDGEITRAEYDFAKAQLLA